MSNELDNRIFQLGRTTASIPVVEGATFMLGLRKFAAELEAAMVPAATDPMAAPAVEGPFLVPLPQAVELMAQMVSNEFKTQVYYTYYANMLRGLAHDSIAEEFTAHAEDELEHANYLLRRIGVLSPGGISIPPYPPPTPMSDPQEIIQEMIVVEQMGLSLWKQLHAVLGDNPMKYTVEQFLQKEEEHQDELWQLVDPVDPMAAAPMPTAEAPSPDPTAAPKTASEILEAAVVRKQAASVLEYGLGMVPGAALGNFAAPDAPLAGALAGGVAGGLGTAGAAHLLSHLPISKVPGNMVIPATVAAGLLVPAAGATSGYLAGRGVQALAGPRPGESTKEASHALTRQELLRAGMDPSYAGKKQHGTPDTAVSGWKGAANIEETYRHRKERSAELDRKMKSALSGAASGAVSGWKGASDLMGHDVFEKQAVAVRPSAVRSAREAAERAIQSGNAVVHPGMGRQQLFEGLVDAVGGEKSLKKKVLGTAALGAAGTVAAGGGGYALGKRHGAEKTASMDDYHYSPGPHSAEWGRPVVWAFHKDVNDEHSKVMHDPKAQDAFMKKHFGTKVHRIASDADLSDFVRLNGGVPKTAADLTPAARAQVADDNFVFPKTKKYPIHDEDHALAALGLVGMQGSAKEKATVRAAVEKKYPDLEMQKKSWDIFGTKAKKTQAALAALDADHDAVRQHPENHFVHPMYDGIFEKSDMRNAPEHEIIHLTPQNVEAHLARHRAGRANSSLHLVDLKDPDRFRYNGDLDMHTHMSPEDREVNTKTFDLLKQSAVKLSSDRDDAIRGKAKQLLSSATENLRQMTDAMQRPDQTRVEAVLTAPETMRREKAIFDTKKKDAVTLPHTKQASLGSLVAKMAADIGIPAPGADSPESYMMREQQLAAQQAMAEAAHAKTVSMQSAQAAQQAQAEAQAATQQAQESQAQLEQMQMQAQQASQMQIQAQQSASEAEARAAEHSISKMQLGMRVNQMRQELANLVMQDPVSEHAATVSDLAAQGQPATPQQQQEADVAAQQQEMMAQQGAAAGGPPPAEAQKQQEEAQNAEQEAQVQGQQAQQAAPGAPPKTAAKLASILDGAARRAGREMASGAGEVATETATGLAKKYGPAAAIAGAGTLALGAAHSSHARSQRKEDMTSAVAEGVRRAKTASPADRRLAREVFNGAHDTLGNELRQVVTHGLPGEAFQAAAGKAVHDVGHQAAHSGTDFLERIRPHLPGAVVGLGAGILGTKMMSGGSAQPQQASPLTYAQYYGQ